jgi:hypothetical protein
MKILLVVYDNESRISYFPTGIAYIAAACRAAGRGGGGTPLLFIIKMSITTPKNILPIT